MKKVLTPPRARPAQAISLNPSLRMLLASLDLSGILH
jgi:hypothetical protein